MIFTITIRQNVLDAKVNSKFVSYFRLFADINCIFLYVPNIISNLLYIFKLVIKKPPNESNDQEKNIDDQKEEHFLALDSDGDKRITREELIQYLHKLEGMKDEHKRNKRDPDQISKERDELIEDIFKSKGSLKVFAKYYSYCLNFQS